jgi:hypothetical protein
LGISWRRALFFDHQLALPDKCRYYPPSIYTHETVTIPESPSKSPLTVSDRQGPAPLQTITERIVTLFDEFSSQISLWHVAYHDSRYVLNLVADKIAGSKPSGMEQAC